jgi:gas vesicle protein
MADAVIFVTGAAQELTSSEVDFLRRARSLCPVVACVLTKTDFYPAWRRIRALNEQHLAAHCPVPLMPVSSPLRSRAVRANDAGLNAESGFTHLVKFITDQIGGSALDRLAGEAAAEVAALCDQLDAHFHAERAALADAETAKRVVEELTAVKVRVEELKTAAAKWNQTLNDGVTDLTSDVDHDLRARVRVVIAEADGAIEAADPADTWPEMEPWLQSRLADELLANYELLRGRAIELSERVGNHFHEASSTLLSRSAVHNPTSLATVDEFEHKIDLTKMRVAKQAMVALKNAYGGALMFIILGSLVGVSLGPIGIGIGLVMGHRGLREEKKRQVQRRRAEARNAIRRYCDQVVFVASKDSRDTLRRVQRQLRDHYSGLAEELNRSNAQALAGASEAAKRTQSDRESRLKDVDSELARVRQLRQRAQAVIE